MKKQNSSAIANTNKDTLQQQEQKLLQWSEDAIKYGRSKGLDGIEVSSHFSYGYSVNIRKQSLETLEHDREKSLTVTVIQGKKRGSASSSDLSSRALQDTIDAASSFAKYVADDPHYSLPETDELAFDYPNCDLFDADTLSIDEAINLAIDCEKSGLDHDSRISNSEGASICSHATLNVLANSQGFVGSYPISTHSLSACFIASKNGSMERDYDFVCGRSIDCFQSAASIGKRAAQKTVARLGSKQLTTQEVPVLFVPERAVTLIKRVLSAIRGSMIYKNNSFLNGCLNQSIASSLLTLTENPHEPGAFGSRPFDSEGVRTRKQTIIENGSLLSYLLSTYSANQLGMKTTGHAGGASNIYVSDSGESFEELLVKMGRGLVVTETMGHGVNLLTGDYSQGAAGFWVEGGQIQYPVHEITIASNLQQMLNGISAIGTDLDRRFSIKTGSILIDTMMVAGA
jgi:PmbA protein